MKWTDEQIVEWHKKAFPNATLETQLKKVEDELQEMQDAIDKFLKDKTSSDDPIEEVADVYIASVVLAVRFNSMIGALVYNIHIKSISELMIKSADCAEAVLKAVDAKMDKNVKREWNETTPGYYQHKETIQ